MSDFDWVSTLVGSLPDFGFALALFILCQRNADLQRKAYQEQISSLYAILQRMLESQSRMISSIESAVARKES